MSHEFLVDGAIDTPLEQQVDPTTPESVRDNLVEEAVQQIVRRDTLDVLDRRIRGASMLKTRSALIAGVPAVGAMIMSEGAAYMPPSIFIGGTTEIVAGALVAGVGYVGQRLREKGKLESTDQAQRIVRDHLEEPVDIIRGKGRRQETAIRWYGADANFNKGEAVTGFAKIVDFAEQHDVREIVTSANLLNVSEKPAEGTYRKTTTKQLLSEKKRLPIDDKKADEELLHLKTDEARKLLEQLQSASESTRTDAIIKRLRELKPDHPVLRSYSDWKRLGQSEALLPGVLRTVRNSIERNIQAKNDAVAVHLPMYDQETGTLLANVPHRTMPIVAVSPTGVQSTTIIGTAEHAYVTSQRKPFSAMVGGDMDAFIEGLLEKKYLSAQDQADLELALYHSLQRKPEKVIDTTTSRSQGNHSYQAKTLYERLAVETPRTLPVLRKRGTVARDEQTIEYRRPRMRTLAVKVGAFALAAGIGAGLGYGENVAWISSDNWEWKCILPKSITFTDPQDRPKIDQAACDASYSPVTHTLGSAAEGYASAEGNYEDELLLRLYQSGILSPDTIARFSGVIDDKWAKEKIADLESRYNLYGGVSSPVMDAEYSGNNAAIWSLDPQNGAKTDGYWASNIQNHITINDRPLPGMQTPPLKGTLELDQSYESTTVVPIGTKVPEYKMQDVEFIRELQLPTQPGKTTEPSIGITGRQFLADPSLGTISYGLENENAYNFRTVSLPVINGGDIVAANVQLKDLGTDKVLRQVPATIYQQGDGTFRLRIANDVAGGYLAIQYWIKPNASTEIPLHAERPMTVRQPNDFSAPLNEVLSAADVAPLLKQLGLPANATLEEAAKAIASSRSYGFTPFADEAKKHGAPAIVSPETTTKAMLLAVAKYAENMSEADCNIAGNIELLLTRGQDDTSFLNNANGFHNEGDNVLSQTDSHAFPIKNDGTIVDPTPAMKGKQTPPPAQDFKNSPEAHSDTFGDVIDIALDGLALAGGGFAGKTLTPLYVTRRRRRRYESALAAVPAKDASDEERNVFTVNANMLNTLLHADPATVIDEANLPAYMTQAPLAIVDPVQQLRSVPYGGPKNLTVRVDARREDGSLRISDDTARNLRKMIRNAHVVQSYEQWQREQQQQKQKQQ